MTEQISLVLSYPISFNTPSQANIPDFFFVNPYLLSFMKISFPSSLSFWPQVNTGDLNCNKRIQSIWLVITNKWALFMLTYTFKNFPFVNLVITVKRKARKVCQFIDLLLIISKFSFFDCSVKMDLGLLHIFPFVS